MTRRRVRVPALAAAALVAAATTPALVSAQSGPYDRYLDHDALTQAARDLAGRHANLATVSSLVQTDAGRDVWLMTLGSDEGRPLDQRPALLVVANLEGNRVAGSSTALYVAEHLLVNYGQDENVTRILDENTVYVIPRMNPDGAELVFSMPAYEIPYKPYRGDAAAGGMNAREIGADLNGDGLVTVMRVPDAEGSLMADPDEERLLREAERARAERGMYRVMVEGIDTANVEAYVPMGTDGVNLNKNFQHEFLYFEPHVGPHMVSEPETRALVDFVYDHPNIAAVLTYSAYDNLRTAPPERRTPEPAVTGNPPNVPTNLTAEDRPYFEYVSERFGEITEMSGEGADGEGGSFPMFAYYQMGLPSFTTPAFTVPAGDDSADERWLAHFDSVGVDGYVGWTSATHPELGAVEVGGFRPNARVNPPAADLRGIAESHAEFATWLAGQLAQVEVVETTVEARGDGVWLVSATLANEKYFPTQLQLGQRIRYNRPITVRLQPHDDLTVISGNIQQQVARLEGMGGRSTHTWLVQAPAGTTLQLEVHAERAGGTITAPVTLR